MAFGILIIGSLYFFLPVYLANMAPELFKWIPFLNYPVWKKKFGGNKTWRGVFFASLVGVLVFWLQKWLFQFIPFNRISIIDYADFGLELGFLLGFGAIFGDAVGSFFKRRAGVKPGDSWMPCDQLDFVVGALVLGGLVYVPRIEVAVVLLGLSFGLHILFCRLGYWLGIKKRKF